MKKNLFTLLGVLALSAGVYFFSQSNIPTPVEIGDTGGVLSEVEERREVFAALTVVDSAGNETEYGNFVLDEGASAFDLLEEASTNSEFTFGYNESEFGVFVTSVNGYEPDINTEYWKFVVNDESAQVGVADYVLNEGDWVRFEIESIK